MADYYLAPSLVDLRNEINAANPGRDHTSDGWIGDASHAARLSDHNPDWASNGVVRALDVDVDGCPPDHLIAVAIKDSRVEYVISRGKIYQRNQNFKPLVYTGANKHDKHTHISLRHTKAAEKSGAWGYSAPPPATPTPGSNVGPGGVAPDGSPWGSGKPIDVIVTEVLRGEWGNGPERSRRLQVAGYSPTEVQNAVNARLGAKPGPARPSVAVLADQVIKGQWGQGAERQRRLISAGFDYTAVQAEVNRRLR